MKITKFIDICMKKLTKTQLKHSQAVFQIQIFATTSTTTVFISIYEKRFTVTSFCVCARSLTTVHGEKTGKRCLIWSISK